MNNLLLLIVVASVLGAFRVQATLDQSEFGPKILTLVETLHSVCVLMSGTDESSIAKVIQGEFTDEPKIKAYMKCLFIETGVIDEKGNFNTDVLVELLPPKILDEAVKIFKNCATRTKGIAREEDRVFSLVKCFYDQNPDIFIFF
uniref:Odorant-binding protein n=1 Tax=Anoplophora chinensis TaxID=217632 RepID=A0A2H4ZB30_ANOCN|nr:odorant-binding protein [Anoplophora chinensis]